MFFFKQDNHQWAMMESQTKPISELMTPLSSSNTNPNPAHQVLQLEHSPRISAPPRLLRKGTGWGHPLVISNMANVGIFHCHVDYRKLDVLHRNSLWVNPCTGSGDGWLVLSIHKNSTGWDSWTATGWKRPKVASRLRLTDWRKFIRMISQQDSE